MRRSTDPDQATLDLPAGSVDPAADWLIDLHSHLAPGVDDGADSLDRAIRAVGRLAHAGVRHVVTTPHIDASLISRPEAFEEDQRKTEAAWEKVAMACRHRRPSLAFHMGREILLDTSRPDTTDPRVRLARGPYVLVEYPRLTIPTGSEDVLYHIGSQGHRPVIAHVERYHYGTDREEVLEEWRDAGAIFQVNAASLLGKYGPMSRDLAWDLLEWGAVDLLASDYHARGEPWILESIEALIEAGGQEQLHLLYRVNPARVLAGEPTVEVPPLSPPSEGMWEKVTGAVQRLLGGSE